MLQFIRAKKAVISNASMWDTLNLLPREVLPNSYVDRINTTPQCESFMHLHLGFDAEVRIDCGSIMKQVQVWKVLGMQDYTTNIQLKISP